MEFKDALFLFSSRTPVYRNNLLGPVAVTVDVHNTRGVVIEMSSTRGNEGVIGITNNERRAATYRLASTEEIFLTPREGEAACWVKITAHVFEKSLREGS